MNTTRPKSRQTKIHLKSIVALAALVVFSTPTSTAIAQSGSQFEIAETALLLEASLMLHRNEIQQSDFDMLIMAESCKNPAERLQARNRPWMMVRNTSTNNDVITSVEIDLTEPGFEFGDGDHSGDGFNGLLSILSGRSDSGVSLDSVSYGIDNTVLELNFSGLDAGMAAIFQIDIDEPGGVLMFPDYREAMLGANTGDGPGSLAVMTTNFSIANSTTQSFARAGDLSTSGLTEGYHRQTMVTVTPSTIIPEPTSIVLLLAGLTGVVATRRYR